MTGRLGFHRNLFCRMESTSEEREAPARDVQPYFTFGVIADVQFADRADGLSGWLTMRYYRQSRVHLRSAIKEWNGESTLPTFILQLGDIIDGANRKLRTSNESLQVVLKEMEDMKAPFHHIWGNHEFYNFDRDYLTKSKLNTKWMEDERLDGAKPFCAGNTDPLEYYAYHFSPFSNFRIVVVDAYDLSVIGRESSSHKGQESAQFLDSRFQNKSGDSRGHVPVHPEAKRSNCLAWNYKEMLDLIQSHSCVVCYIAGHDHSGGYCRDAHGIHHVTMEGVIESPPGTNAFATVYMYKDRMVLNGRGRVKTRVLYYRE
ncbi:manganese-dependent ADP-ribose/CDP-alcohol diphosphatase isoform X3 [Ascaphus truei]|uniref:manganese-dependent ADP-ribose/CDP-alcohol diphosphatase isoform X3 n=1 Tax=Ascaphus truei TaxID=8439 RepID=UPI003F590844